MAKRKRKLQGKKIKSEITIWDVCAGVIVFLDEILDEAEDILKAGEEGIWQVCGAAVAGYDRLADLIDWFVRKTFILFARRWHETRMTLIEYKRVILRDGAIFFALILAMVGIFSSTIDYEYAYNGRPLGLVKEQRDVLEILDLVSTELSHEYGSNITIDPETDISFKPVISLGREIDDADTVLKRFTYMGDIQATAYAITVDGQTIAIVDSKEAAEEILQDVQSLYISKKSSKKYEEIGFKEDVQILETSTTLAKISSKSATLKKIKSGKQQESTYTVKSGDTLYGICEKLGVTFSELKKMNSGIDENSVLHIGDKLTTQQAVPLLTVRTVEVSTFAEKVKYDTVYKKSSKYYKGEEIVQRSGTNGKAKVTARLVKENGKTVDRTDLSSEIIKEPVSKIVIKGTKAVPATKGTGQLQRPVAVSVYAGYGMRWGRMHYGLDYAAATGTAIRAADGGTVVSAGWSGAYGLRITIDHGGNIKTLYAHCSAIYVSAGDKVYKGQKIAAVGSTGRSTGAHCHFEVFVNGKNVNPANYV